MTHSIDFVVPIKKMGAFTVAVLEGIFTLYEPNRVIIVTNKDEITRIRQVLLYKSHSDRVHFIDEEYFFWQTFGVTMDSLQKVYNQSCSINDEKHREFGWWYQQLIKLGVSSQIPDISDTFVVWDGDLIPLEKWDLIVQGKPHIAILQSHSKNEFNQQEYSRSVKYLLGFDMYKPTETAGTFVTHHMVFQKKYVEEMLQHIMTNNIVPWPLFFMSLPHRFYRISEYLLYTSYMIRFHPDAFGYYPYHLYGKSGIRFRDTKQITNDIQKHVKGNNIYFTYQNIVDYFSGAKTSYVQFEHVYHLLGHEPLSFEKMFCTLP